MWDDRYKEIDENIHPCKGCEDYIDGECISKGGCGNCVHLSCVDRYTEVSQYCNGDMRGEE